MQRTASELGRQVLLERPRVLDPQTAEAVCLVGVGDPPLQPHSSAKAQAQAVQQHREALSGPPQVEPQRRDGLEPLQGDDAHGRDLMMCSMLVLLLEWQKKYP